MILHCGAAKTEPEKLAQVCTPDEDNAWLVPHLMRDERAPEAYPDSAFIALRGRPNSRVTSRHFAMEAPLPNIYTKT
jgi:hypothetical protein